MTNNISGIRHGLTPKITRTVNAFYRVVVDLIYAFLEILYKFNAVSAIIYSDSTAGKHDVESNPTSLACLYKSSARIFLPNQ